MFYSVIITEQVCKSHILKCFAFLNILGGKHEICDFLK